MYPYLLKYYADLLHLLQLPPEKARAVQLQRLRRLVEFARERSPFYRDLYAKAGVMDLTIRSMDDVRRLPIVDKRMMLTFGVDWVLTVPKDTPRLKREFTSGSTGEPFTVYVDRVISYSSHLRVFTGSCWHGYRPTQRIVTVWRYPADQVLEVERVSMLGRIQKTLRLFRRVIIPVQEDLDGIIVKLRTQPPDMLFSTCSMLELIARRMLQRGETVPVRLVMSGSETLLPSHHDLFKRVFQGTVTTLYGCIECPTMAIGDIANGLRVMTNTVFMELLGVKQTEDGPTGEILISNLINYDMPFIRYRLGDIVHAPRGGDAMLAKRIGCVQGRSDDVLMLPGGFPLAHHRAFMVASEVFDSVRQYKFVRTKDGRVILRIVPLAAADRESIRQRVSVRWQSLLPGEPPEIEFMEDLPFTPGGKFKAMEQL
jgi:phenylacetate-CoA ligase